MGDTHKTTKEQNAAVWSRASATYSSVGPRFFQHFGERLVDLAPLQPGDKVLDIASGRGALLFPAAEKVGPQGKVTGVDYSQGMVEQTNADIRTRGIENASVLHMDAERLDFPNASFDCLICGFAIFFFPNLDKALSEFHRVLKPGGSLTVSTWGTKDQRWTWLEGMSRRSRTESAPGPTPRFDTPEGMTSILESAGFADIQIAEEQLEIFFADEEEWWATNWSHGARLYLEKLTPERLDQAKAYTRNQLNAMKQPQGIPEIQGALVTLARKPK
jgi:ubiquinone/menaquinone biosynthesis C-methylase UbiE